MSNFLTDDQVYQLNAKHGWFEFGDAQSDVSRAFAQDAIAMHERMRAAAPDLLSALQALLNAVDADLITSVELNASRAAIQKATGGEA